MGLRHRRLAQGRILFRVLKISHISTISQESRASALAFDVTALLRLGGPQEALDFLDRREGRAGVLDSKTIAKLLLVCGRTKALVEGRRIHDYVRNCGLSHDASLCNHLVHMYLKCESFDEAEKVFQSLKRESFDISTWTAIIVARAELGKWTLVFGQLEEMERKGVSLDNILVVALLTACTRLGALEQGKLIQEKLAGTGLELDVRVINVAINMYAKCGCLKAAAQAFERMKTRDVVSWTVIIGAYSHHGEFSVAFDLFQKMLLEGVAPSNVTFVNVLSACETPFSLNRGKRIHALVVESGFQSQIVVANSLLGMYRRCRSVVEGKRLFESMTVKDAVSWTTIITACAQEDGHRNEALELYRTMLHEGVMPKALTVSMVLEACGSLGEMRSGKVIHAQVIEMGLECDIVGISLVNMYAKCGSVKDARTVFNRLKNRCLILWNSMISAYQDVDPHEALQLFRQMQPEGVLPDKITFMAALSACTKAADLENGRMIHTRVVDSGFLADVCVATAIFNMYAKCGNLSEACEVFDGMKFHDVVSWNNMITAYVQYSQGKGAVSLCRRMQLEGMKPDKATFASLLNACSEPDFLIDGQQIHLWIQESGLENDIFMGTALVTMYGNCGSLGSARELFDTIVSSSRKYNKDLVLWTSMITAYAQHGDYRKSLELYAQMHAREIEADRVTFISVLNACAHLSDLADGKTIHARIIRSGLSTDVAVANSVIFMYGKCGCFNEATESFEKVKEKDVVLWSSLIAAYARHGHGGQALWNFRRMRQDGIDLSNSTFTGILSACSHVGLVDEGCEFFSSMSEVGLKPDMEHHSCVVDLLARSGNLQAAEHFISKMPVAANGVILTALLAACRIHGDVERARRVADKLEALDSQNDAPYVTLSNIEMHG